MFKKLMNAMFGTESDSVHLSDGFKTEDPSIQQKRAEATQRMSEINRVSLLAGGNYSRHNTVLAKTQK